MNRLRLSYGQPRTNEETHGHSSELSARRSLPLRRVVLGPKKSKK
jgi:hypothetical protein